MPKSKRWKLDPAEVTWGTGGHTSTKRRKLRLSRQLDERSLRVRMLHLPTGIEVIGEVSTGNYSRRDMHAARDALVEKLFAQLENKVARHFNISGR